LLFSAGACGHLHGWDWKKWKELKKLVTGPSTITGLAASVHTPIIVLNHSNHKMTIWNYETEKTLHEFDYPAASPLFVSLNLLSSGKFFLVGTNSGELRLNNSETGELVASSNVAGSQTTITSLALEAGDTTCYGSTSDGKIYIWDLLPVLTLLNPIKTLTLQQAEILQEKIKSSIQFNERKWLELTQLLVQWQRRFDIQISETHPISVGEFDIFI
jgi:WD40 repeat protein